MHENSISIIGAVICSFFSYAFGINEHLEFLIYFITLDLFIGVLASFINPKLMFNSRKMARGICKKIVILSLVTFAHQLDVMLHTDRLIGTACTYYFIVNEGLSCLENSCKCGLKVPPILKNSLEQLKEIKK